jgi:hypothetical protein
MCASPGEVNAWEQLDWTHCEQKVRRLQARIVKATNRLRSRGALQRLEPDEGKLSCPVLRGGSGSNATSLPDRLGRLAYKRDSSAVATSVPARLGGR